jgi:hypothetical protein
MCGKRWNSKRSELLVRCKSQEKAQVAINAKHFTEVEVKKDILSPVADAGRAGRERERAKVRFGLRICRRRER